MGGVVAGFFGQDSRIDRMGFGTIASAVVSTKALGNRRWALGVGRWALGRGVGGQNEKRGGGEKGKRREGGG